MKIRTVLFFTWIIVSCACPLLVAQGLYWESTVTAMGSEQNTKTFYLPKKMKTVASNSGEVIILLDKQLMITINPMDTTYSELSFGEMEVAMKSSGAKMDANVASMKESMKTMPEEQRKQMEKMMEVMGVGGESKPWEVVATSEQKNISGYACHKYVLKQGEREAGTVWATNQITEFASMKKDFEEFSNRMMSMNPLGRELATAMRKIDGFPIEAVMGEGIRTVVTMVEARAIDLKEFSVPKGYRKVPSPMLQE
jgi:hypothetical protein